VHGLEEFTLGFAEDYLEGFDSAKPRFCTCECKASSFNDGPPSSEAGAIEEREWQRIT